MTFQTPKTVKSKIIAPTFVSGSHTNISFTYNTGSDVINASGSLGGGGSSNITWLADVTVNNTVLTLNNSNSMVLVKNGSSAFTVFLPAISGCNGKIIRVKRMGTALVTLSVNSADTSTKFIDVSGTTSILLGAQYSTFDLVANETDGGWYLI